MKTAQDLLKLCEQDAPTDTTGLRKEMDVKHTKTGKEGVISQVKGDGEEVEVEWKDGKKSTENAEDLEVI